MVLPTQNAPRRTSPSARCKWKLLHEFLAFNLINPCSTSGDVTVTSLTHCKLFVNFAKEILLSSSNSTSSPASRELLLCSIWCSLEQHMKFLKRAEDFTFQKLFFCRVPGSPRYSRTGTEGRGKRLPRKQESTGCSSQPRSRYRLRGRWDGGGLCVF